MDERLSAVETRLDTIEVDMQKLRDTVHSIANEQQATSNQIALVKGDTDRILHFVEGTDKVFGIVRKHWRTILKFGAGVVTAYGISSPSIQRALGFATKFFGI